MKRALIVLLVLAWSVRTEAAITMTPNPLNVGSVLVGDSGQANGTLSSDTNVRVDLVVSTCTGGAGTFTLTPSNGVNLLSPKTISVTYAPTAIGTRDCTVRVYEESTTIQLGTFTIRGTGITPPKLSVNATSIDSGQARWNDAAPVAARQTTRNLTVTNTGGQTLMVTNVTITGTNATDFSITAGGTSATILAGNARTWTFTFNPSAAGARTATITFASNDPMTPNVVVSITGTGTNAVIVVNDPTFGIVPSGSTAAVDITIANNGAATKGPLGVTNAAISGGGGWFTFNGCGNGTLCTFTIPLSITNTAAIVGVRCTPPVSAPANTMQTAMVTFTSDTDSNTDNTSTVSCTSGSSSLVTNMSTVTFPPQLVGTTGSPVPVTVTNNGNVAATFYFTKTGSAQSMFSVTSSCGASTSNQCAIAANGGTVMFTVAVMPTIEGDVSAGLTLTSSASPSPQLALSARGIDHHISLPASVAAPDTYRTSASTVTVPIQNIGEHPLSITEVSILTDTPVWALAEPFMPFEIAGLGTHDLHVVFTPGQSGKAADGFLQITSDDRAAPMTTVTLTGNGKDRNITVAPYAIDFGDRAVGTSSRLSELAPEAMISVLNLDETSFMLREFTIESTTAFATDARDVELVPGSTNTFDVIFTPPREGDYEGTLLVFLDQDPLPHVAVPIRGRALTVNVHGGGGCSTHGAGALPLALALLLLRRRRR